MKDTEIVLIFACVFLLIFSMASFGILQIQWKLNSELQENYERSQRDKNQKFWFFYYSKPKKQSFGIDELEESLLQFELGSLRHIQGEFILSELCAFLERYLENLGWNTSIAVGIDIPFTWLLVETSEGNYTPVEPLLLETIHEDNEDYDLYFNYDYLFLNIYSAYDISYDLFNWWSEYNLYSDPEWNEIVD